MRESLDDAEDEDGVRITLKDVTPLEIAQLKARFKAVGGLPPEVTVETAPFTAIRKRANPRFSPWSGAIPLSDVATPYCHASGTIAGRGFLLYNQGETTSNNELIVLKPGSTDRFNTIKLPQDIAEANIGAHAVALSPTELLVQGTHIADPDGSDVTQLAYIYNAVSKQFTSVPPLPIGLIGQNIVAFEQDGDKKVMVCGGRSIVKDGEHWTVALGTDPLSRENVDNGVALENTGWIFSCKENAWTPVTDAPEGVGIASVTAADGKIWFIGGETIITGANGANESRATQRVMIFDPMTGTFAQGPALPLPVTSATALRDEEGRLLLLGGQNLLDHGATIVNRDVVLRLDPNSKEPTWKPKSKLPAPAADLQAIPRPGQTVIGPFFTDNGAEFLALD
jgi:hypothetical protein